MPHPQLFPHRVAQILRAQAARRFSLQGVDVHSLKITRLLLLQLFGLFLEDLSCSLPGASLKSFIQLYQAHLLGEDLFDPPGEYVVLGGIKLEVAEVEHQTLSGSFICSHTLHQVQILVEFSGSAVTFFDFLYEHGVKYTTLGGNCQEK